MPGTPIGEPVVFRHEFGFMTQVDATVRVRRDDGTFADILTTAVLRPGQSVTPRFLKHPDGTQSLELIDEEGERRSVALLAGSSRVQEPWPRVETIPPGVWTKLAHGSGSVLNETNEATSVTVAEDGTLTFGAAMKWQSSADDYFDYSSWGEDE